ncbi:pimeloyl-ACP methyl ester carboxylesterase [Salsuginibacillus halophilus]|uniref:Pimeloyl-ACP methyl ester carboxylesterase n=1 Tax=Salsuginibacillus halophilus TaxID=517424 RepID=A0A2P8H934_9BACI|nr:alpha/beta hydrolase [Salsuginibacillus halophilus]PSL42743.1 pimeloyl-ACP methyl ester carboxylesterase [Salsuginibacillus halophilus]
METRFIETEGATLHTVLAGPEKGELVVLLHGFPEFWYGWRRQIQALAAAGYRVAVPDQRGYNLSSKPQDVESYDTALLADDVAELIQALGYEKAAAVIGHDWGGAVGWYLAITRPEVMRMFIPINIPHPGVMPVSSLKNPTQLLKSSYMAFFQIPAIPEKAMQAGEFTYMMDGLKRTSQPGAFHDEELRAYERAWSQPGALTGMLNWYRAMRTGTMAHIAGEAVDIPVRMLWGIGDQFLSTTLAKDSLKLCRDEEAVFIGEATHWVLHEQPALVNDWILHWLNN